MFLKRILGVKRNTNNCMVYWELGRVSMHNTRMYRILKYWTKIINTNNCIIEGVYSDMLASVDNRQAGYCWAQEVKRLLSNLGMQDAWIDQRYLDTNMFLRKAKQRLRDVFSQETRAACERSPKCYIYNHITDKHELQAYLTKPLLATLRKSLSQIRLSSHKLNIEAGRYARTNRIDRKCTKCDLDDMEDEYHFILICPFYRVIRERYIKPYYYSRPSMYKLVQLLSTDKLNILTNLFRFITKAFKERG